MILLDTHVWIWWVHESEHLSESYREYIEEHETEGLGISAISCWEVAKLVEYDRLKLHRPIAEWFNLALSYPGIQWLDLTPRIIVESTQLPGAFHRDPADQLIVASARVYDCPLVTQDQKIRSYMHVSTKP